MTESLNQQNKAAVLEMWGALDGSGHGPRTVHPEVRFYGHEPVGELVGFRSFIDEFWAPLRRSIGGQVAERGFGGDFERETHLFFAGQSNGQRDGNIANDGHHWVTGTGIFHGTFTYDYLGIPATNEPVTVRWGEFCRLIDGVVVEIYFMIDMIDLMQQAGCNPLPPSRGIDGLYPPPRAGDGNLVEPSDPEITDYSLDHIRRFIFDGLNAYDETDLTSMGMADWFDSEVQWYGPGGIGGCLSFKQFEDLHQKPWLVAFPDRQVQDLTALFAEGVYSGAPGWAGVLATHEGSYLGVDATGRSLKINGLDWWKRDGERYIENWVFVDMIHLFSQMGVDLLAAVQNSR
ncbi:MAG: ester cyclase [Acidimicrobiales bacterium]